MTNAEIYAWIFLSIGKQPTSLRDIIAVADGINHAIPTYKELQVSFSWLQAHELVRKEGKHYLLTEVGIELHHSCSHKTYIKCWEAITQKFLELSDIAAPPDDITEMEVDNACKSYHGEF